MLQRRCFRRAIDLGVLVLFLTAIVATDRISAQSPGTSAAAYLDAVLLREQDVQGYRLLESATDPERDLGVLADRLLSFAGDAGNLNGVQFFWVEARVLVSSESAVETAAAFRREYNVLNPSTTLVTATPAGEIAGLTDSYAYRLQIVDRNTGSWTGAALVWRRGATVFRLESRTTSEVEPFDETVRLAELQHGRSLMQPAFTTGNGNATPTRTPEAMRASGTGPFVIGGSIAIDGDPVPAGTTVSATIGMLACGRVRVTQEGRYSLSVATAAEVPGCGSAGAQVRVSVLPPYGEGWTLSMPLEFSPGENRLVNIDVDLFTLPPDPEHVPLFPRYWPDPSAVPVAICGITSESVTEAARAAVEMWESAHRDRGLKFRLVLDPAVCEPEVPGIKLGETSIEGEPETLGMHSALDANGEACAARPEERCEVHTSIVLLNLAAMRKDQATRIFVFAHEIGHALGLSHAPRCSGATIMFEDLVCRYPRRTVGVDDIAALNQRVAEYSVAPADRAVDHLSTARGATPRTELGAVRSFDAAIGVRGIDPSVLRFAERLTITR